MSFIDHLFECNTEHKQYFALIFAIPCILRLVLGAVKSAKIKKCYYQLLLIMTSVYLYESYQYYITYAFFMITVNIVILSISTADSLKIPNEIELLNALSFFSIIFTPTVFWASTLLTWLMVILHITNLSAFNIILAVLQLAPLASLISTVNLCSSLVSYSLLSLSFFITLISVELKSKNR